MEIKGLMEKGGIMMCKLKGRMDEGHYYVQIMRWMQKGGIMMCSLKGRMDKGGHYEVVNERSGWKRWHYDVQIKRADG